MNDILQIGSKNYNLLKIRQMCNVPEFRVINAMLFKKLIAEYIVNDLPLEKYLDIIISKFMSSSDMNYQKTLANEIQTLISDMPLSTLIEHALKHAFHTLGQAVSLRSSAVNEDSSKCSFAGIYESVINITSEEELFTAYKDVCASIYSFRSLLYHQENNIEFNHNIAMCMMNMITPIQSGVAFSCDTYDGDSQYIYIELSNGYGIDLMNGAVNTTKYLVQKNLINIESNNIINQIANIVNKISNLYDGKIVDVEFCIDNNNVIWILQARLETYWNNK